MTVDTKLYTVEEFLEFSNLAENADKRLELIDGVIVEMPPSSKRTPSLRHVLFDLSGLLLMKMILTMSLARKVVLESRRTPCFNRMWDLFERVTQ